MKKNQIILFTMPIFLSFVFGNLFISEVAEGSSNNKYIEIYNAGNSTVDLSGYAFPSVANAPTVSGEHEYWNTFTEGASILSGDVYVVCHGSADDIIQVECNQYHTYLSNGDDGYCLVQGNEDSYESLDCVGDFNGDPGSGWDVAGVSNGTKDHTLVRKSSVVSGNSGDWFSSAGTNEDDSEWIVYDQDIWDYLGYHDMDNLVPDHTVNSGSYYYTPSLLEIEVGETVEWINDGGLHDVVVTDGPVLFSLPSCTGPCVIGSYTFLEAGTYDYICSIGSHAAQGMVGTVVVSGPCDDLDLDGICDDEDDCIGEFDCAGVCNGESIVDACGECGGENTCLINVTFNVNMSLENISEDGVGLYGLNGDWSNGINMDDVGEGIFSTTVQLTPETFNLFKYKNGSDWENVDELDCSWFDDPDGDGWGYWDRYLDLTGVAQDIILNSVCFGECDDCGNEVLGCTDPLADNYNPDANVDDESCEYSFDTPLNLFFSEYAEGSSNNKYLEIYNASDESVDISNYSLSSCSNGCNDGVSWDYPDNVTFEIGTMVNSGDVYIVCHGSADDIIQNDCDQTFTYLSNGDDVFALTQIGSGTVLDIIGSIGDDPGSGWDVAGVSNGTKDHTLVRKSSVTSGNSDWDISAGSDAGNSEWVVLDQNDWTFLGSHPHDFAATCDDSEACNYGEEGDCNYADDGFNCDGEALVNITFNVNMANESVDIEGYGLDLFINDPYGYHDMFDEDGDDIWTVSLILVANNEYSYKFKNGDDWEANFNDLECGAGDEYGNRIFMTGETDMEVGPFCFNSCNDCETSVTCGSGDTNNDNVVNVADIVLVVNGILGFATLSEAELCNSDIDGDGIVNVADIVNMVTMILGTSLNLNSLPEKVDLIKNSSNLTLSAEGIIGAIQLTIHHIKNPVIKLSENSLIGKLKTDGNETSMIIVLPEVGKLFEINSDFEILNMSAYNLNGKIEINLVNEFGLLSNYPNPFNPVTTISYYNKIDGHISINIFDLNGRLINNLISEIKSNGYYQVIWDGKDEYGKDVTSGIYLLTMESPVEVYTNKITLLR